MANPQSSNEVDNLSTKLETSMKNNDSLGFRQAIDEVSLFKHTHTPQQTQAFVESVSNKLKENGTLPQVAIFNAETEFSRLDSDKNGSLNRLELTQAQNRVQSHNPLDGALLKVTIDSQNQEEIAPADLGKMRTAAVELEADKGLLKQLFKKSTPDSMSLYEKVADKDGNIDLARLQNFRNLAEPNPAALGLSQKDMDVMKWLEPKSDGVVRNYLKPNELADLCKSKGMDLAALRGEAPKTNADVTPSTTAAEKKNDLSQRVIKVDARAAHAQEQTRSDSPKIQTKSSGASDVVGGNIDVTSRRADEARKQQQASDLPTIVVPGKDPVVKPIEPGLRAADQTPKAIDSSRKPVEQTPRAIDPARKPVEQASKAIGSSVKPVETPKGTAKDATIEAVNGANKGVEEKRQASDIKPSPATPASPETERKDQVAKDGSTVAKSQIEQQKEKIEQKPGSVMSQSAEQEQKMRDALTVKKGESYSHCAERLLALAGNNDPTGQEIRQLARQLWIADNKRKGGTLKVNQVLGVDQNIKANSSLKKLFAA